MRNAASQWGWAGQAGGGDEVAVGDGVGDFGFDELCAGVGEVGGEGGVGGAFASFEDAGGGEDLGAVTDGGDGFVGVGEVTDDLEDTETMIEDLRTKAYRPAELLRN